MSDLLLITPPFTQLNTPYPATAYLKGFLDTRGISSYQADLGIDVINDLFTEKCLHKLFQEADQSETIASDNSKRIFALREEYKKTIEPVIQFLQGENPSLARQICSGSFLPEGSRFDQLDDLYWAFGNMGLQDQAKHLATLYLEDLSDFIVECVDKNFGFSRYAEQLGKSANSFDELHAQLCDAPSFIDQITIEQLKGYIIGERPKLICFSIPFPGNLYSAFRCARFIKDNRPEIKICMGGGFPNTELRSLTDTRVFDYFDFITLDDGELPLELLHDYVTNPTSDPTFKRTFRLVEGKVSYINNCSKPDYKQSEVGVPSYADLNLTKYISVIGVANPMHSLWSDGRWNKLTMAHGCYWGKCTFCDISLDYIKLYEPIAAKTLVDRMEILLNNTGESGFHFVDEAAPPALMREVAIEILKRKLVVTWWTNIRFEKSFTRDLCQLLKASGCVAVSGGLEVASDRLLSLIDKGVTVEQVANVTHHFTEAGIMVHAYLMYGYPTQTIQETVDSLEMVRQLFELGVIQSGFWHQFALTAHSPIGMIPSDYGIIPQTKEITFANNDIDFEDTTGIDHSKFSYGLKKSLYNFMHDTGYEFPLQEWFDFEIPETRVNPHYIEECLNTSVPLSIKPTARILWLGGMPIVGETKKGKVLLQFHALNESFQIKIEVDHANWLKAALEKLSVTEKALTFAELKKDFEVHFEDFELFWFSKPVKTLMKQGLFFL